MRKLILLIASLLLASCFNSSSSSSNNNLPPLFSGVFAPTVPVTPAEANSPYANVLADCVYSATRTISCTLGELPLLSVNASPLTVDQIMDRVVVSDPWMGARFREVLEMLPPDLLQLFQSVTAIVVARDIIPSFYTTATAAIYIDPRYLWLTPAEFATILVEQDFRTAFGANLGFTAPWRILDNGVEIVRGFDPNGGSGTAPTTRVLDDIRLPLAYLLTHELAHAADFIPPVLQSNLRTDLPVLDLTFAIQGQRISDDLVASFPLQSQVMFGLASVKFLGVTATTQQNGYTPQFVGDAFKQDSAAMPYAFSTQFEDLATAFDELMLLYWFDLERDNAITGKPAMPSSNDNDYLIAWGQRSRVRDALVKQRALFAQQRILPSLDLSAWAAALPAPVELTIGAGWAESIVVNGQPVPQKSGRTAQAVVIDFGPGHVQ